MLVNDGHRLSGSDVVTWAPVFFAGHAVEVFRDDLLTPREPVASAHEEIIRPTQDCTLAHSCGRFSGMMVEYDQEKWFDLYSTALVELERAAITGRISDARAEITIRLETLKQHPGLHKPEYQAIQDALNNLRSLEREEERMAVEDKKRLLQESARKLQSVASKFQNGQQENSSEG
jgi:hypothetical protein